MPCVVISVLPTAIPFTLDPNDACKDVTSTTCPAFKGGVPILFSILIAPLAATFYFIGCCSGSPAATAPATASAPSTAT